MTTEEIIEEFEEKFPTDIHKVWTENNEPFMGGAYSESIKKELKLWLRSTLLTYGEAERNRVVDYLSDHFDERGVALNDWTFDEWEKLLDSARLGKKP